HIGACRHDTDPVNHPSPECQAVKQALLNGVYNIRVMGTLISRNRELCHDKIGTARFEQWLASYEGRNYPHRNQWCQPSDATREVIRYRQWLLGKIEPPPRKPATARNSPKRGKQRVAAHPQAEKTKNNTRSP
ncbi:MAG TPA: hypothetical protein PLV85_26360, partial [Polyangiaceae bacterium]|nr:hypothetical protein [Polyangiaceae bacterium]